MTTARQPGSEWAPPTITVRPWKKIVGFWHIGAVGDWSRISREQYAKLRASGLYDVSEKIVVGFIGGKNRESELQVPILEDSKFELFATEDAQDFEFPTLARLWQEAQQRPSFLCYYLHTKGASQVGTPRERTSNAWREYMEYFNLEKWQDCVTVLNEYETCGVELQTNDHYSGNFWWATSDYIVKLPDGLQYWQQHRDDRTAAELYLCLAQPRAYCFHDFVENLYDHEIASEAYRR